MQQVTRTGFESFNEIATLHVELAGTDLPIWREVEVPTSLTLKTLHEVVQAVMSWFDLHLWEFRIGDTRYGPRSKTGEQACKDASKVRLRELLKPGLTKIGYVYDLGDHWEHLLILSDIRPGNPETAYPRYVRGHRNAPPEDCGGMAGFHELLAALVDPAHPEHDDAKTWAGDYDPYQIDELPIEYALSRIAQSRNAARKRLMPKASE